MVNLYLLIPFYIEVYYFIAQGIYVLGMKISFAFAEERSLVSDQNEVQKNGVDNKCKCKRNVECYRCCEDGVCFFGLCRCVDKKF
ncbi:hypothetical protein Hanom_Chr03g00187781 [Helianthus anomalus]